MMTPLHRLSLITIVGLLALLLTACGPTSYSVDEHIDRAQQAHAEGDLRTAIIEIKNALQQEPSRAEARRLLGLYSLESGDAVAAEAELIRARDLSADPDAVRLLLARAWLMQGKNAQVLDATAPEQRNGHPSPEALTLRGQALLAQGQAAEARDALQQALELESHHAEALFSMAWVEWLAGDADAAREYVDTALESDPQFDRAWELLGDLEREAGDLAAAEVAYGQAVDSTRLPFSPQLKRALTRIALQDYDAANQDIRALQRMAGQHPAVSHARGLIAFYQQRYDDARIDFEDSLARDPAYMPAVFYLGATQYALNNWRQAESYLSRYVTRFPNATQASRLLALTRLQEGDTQRAERALRAVLEHDPEDRETLTMMGNLYLAQGRADEALHHLRQVAALEPDSAVTRAQIGMTLIQQGQREEGLGELQRAIDMAPDDTARLEIAVILEHLRAGEFERALAAIDRFAQRDTANPALVYNLKGMTYMSMGDTTTAEATFREGLERAANQPPDIAANLAGLLAREERLQEAEAIAEAALAQHPEHLGLLMTLTQLRLVANDAVGSQALLERAVSAHPQALQPRLALARLHLQLNRSGEAISVLRQGEDVHGESVDWLRLMTFALQRTGDQQATVDVLRRLQEQQPDEADVYFTLGRVLAELGETADGLATLQQGLTLDPDHLGARLAVVRLLIMQGNLEQAVSALEPAQRDHPDNIEVLTQTGIIAGRQGRFAEAIAAFQQAVALNPDERSLTEALAEAQWRAGQHEAAITTMTGWLEHRPQDHEMHLTLANLYLALNRHDEAITNFQQVLEYAPDHVVALNNLAWLLRAEDAEQALSFAERAVELAPQSAPIYDTLGVIQLEMGQPVQALATLREAVKFSDNAPSIRLNLAKALLANAEHAEAEAELRSLLDEYPQFSEREEALRLLGE